jgi:uncharacterized protein YjbJ (UPF0337 family)
MEGVAKERWGKLTDDDLEKIAGKNNQMPGRLQECYAFTKSLRRKCATNSANTAKAIMNQKSTS